MNTLNHTNTQEALAIYSNNTSFPLHTAKAALLDALVEDFKASCDWGTTFNFNYHINRGALTRLKENLNAAKYRGVALYGDANASGIHYTIMLYLPVARLTHTQRDLEYFKFKTSEALEAFAVYNLCADVLETFNKLEAIKLEKQAKIEAETENQLKINQAKLNTLKQLLNQAN